MGVSLNEKKLLILILLIALITSISGIIVYKVGFKRFHIEKSLNIELPEDAQVIDYYRKS